MITNAAGMALIQRFAPRDAADLRTDLEPIEAGIAKSLGGAATSANQFAAMVAMAEDIGLGSFKTSSVLMRHRDGRADPAYTAAAFLLWSKHDGRREAESQLYLTPDEVAE